MVSRSVLFSTIQFVLRGKKGYDLKLSNLIRESFQALSLKYGAHMY